MRPRSMTLIACSSFMLSCMSFDACLVGNTLGGLNDFTKLPCVEEYSMLVRSVALMGSEKTSSYYGGWRKCCQFSGKMNRGIGIGSVIAEQFPRTPFFNVDCETRAFAPSYSIFRPPFRMDEMLHVVNATMAQLVVSTLKLGGVGGWRCHTASLPWSSLPT